ncbi:MAG: MFS transporter [Spirochaetaceae bacterium]
MPARRNVVLLTTGAAVSTFGTGLYAVGTVLYITAQYNSPVLVAAFNFVAFAPAAFFARPIGRVVDRCSQKALLVGSDIARGLLMLAFAALLGTRTLHEPGLLIGFGLLAGLGQAVFVPSVHAYLPRLVEKGELPRANAVRAGGAQLANALGMAVAGYLLGVLGLPVLLAANGLSFLLSALPEAALRPRREKPPAPNESGRLRLGRALTTEPQLRSLLLVNTLMYGISAPVVITIPFILDAGSTEGAATTGVIFATMIIGGLAGFTAASFATRRLGREPVMIRLALLLGAGAMGVVALSPTGTGVVVAAPLLGATAAVVHVGVITLLQRVTAPAHRGRTFATLEAFSAAAAPVGYVFGGFLGTLLMSRLEALYAGLAVLIVLTHVATRPALRRFHDPDSPS